MMNFANANAITIPEGEVASIRFLTNLISTSIDTDGSIYNGCGYLDGYRLSSSGDVKIYNSAYFDSTATGFIPVSRLDTVYIDNCYWFNEGSAMNYICGYDSNFNFIGAKVSSGTAYGTKFIDYVTGDKRHAKAVLKDNENLAYVRVSCGTHLVGQKISGADIKVSTQSSAPIVWEKYLYKNWVKYSTEADGVTIYNGGLGYKDHYRIRSGGAEAQRDYTSITGYIPFVKGDKLYIYPPFTGGNVANTINFYDASFACLGQITDSGASYGICVNNGSKFKTKVVNGVSVLDLSNNTVSGVSDIRYVRIGNNIDSASPISSGADMIVTVNEEIV